MASVAGAAEDDIITMELEPERRRLSPALQRGLFLGLAGAALVALVAAVLIVVLAPASALTWLVVACVVLVLVVVAEIVLLFLARS